METNQFIGVNGATSYVDGPQSRLRRLVSILSSSFQKISALVFFRTLCVSVTLWLILSSLCLFIEFPIANF